MLILQLCREDKHNSAAFDDVYDYATEAFPEAETIVADSARKTPHICNEYYDCILCPEHQVLSCRTTGRDEDREYRSDSKICANCPTRHLCTRSKDCVKTVWRHVWRDYEDLADDVRYTPKYQELYKQRKEKHAMRYTKYRGLARASN